MTQDNKELAENMKGKGSVTEYKLDEFNETVENEVQRTEKAKAEAAHTAKLYAKLKDKYRELEETNEGLLSVIEGKNQLIAKLKASDRHSREHDDKPNQDEQRLFNIVAERMLKRPGSRN